MTNHFTSLFRRESRRFHVAALNCSEEPILRFASCAIWHNYLPGFQLSEKTSNTNDEQVAFRSEPSRCRVSVFTGFGSLTPGGSGFSSSALLRNALIPTGVIVNHFRKLRLFIVSLRSLLLFARSRPHKQTQDIHLAHHPSSDSASPDTEALCLRLPFWC